MTNDTTKYIVRREGYYYFAVPHVETAARWFVKSSLVRCALLLSLGFGAGQFATIPAPTIPVPAVTVPAVNRQTLEQQAAAGGAAIPFPERSALADALERAADDLDRGTDRFTVDERIRTAITASPTSGQWSDDFGKIMEAAISPDTVKYAENLRLIAKGLKR